MYIKKSIKQLVSLVLAFVLSFSVLQVVYAGNPGKFRDEIYVDGVKYIYEIYPNKVTIQAEGHDVYVEINNNGKTKIKGKDVKGLKENETYELSIQNLTQELTDITVYKDGIKVKQINNLADLEKDSYFGQAEVVLGGAIGLGLLVLIIAGVVIVVAGILYVLADAIADAIKKNFPNDYFAAQLITGQVGIDPSGISYAVAVTRISCGLSVYTSTSTKALNAVLGTGLGATSAEIDANKYRGYTYYWHYHTAARNGAHAWYGAGIPGTL